MSGPSGGQPVTLPLSAEMVREQAAASGFPADAVEKVARLMHLLDAINRDAYLRDRFALKGGTALNLFHFGLPRLSVDLDLNYIGSPDRRVMLNERVLAESILERICAQAGLRLRRKALDHLGGKWILAYRRTSGGQDTIEIDLNYGLRVPIWPPRRQDSARLGIWRATEILLLDEHELAGGKVVALLTRTATRDLFDTYHLLTARPLDPARLRLAITVYGAMSPTDWRTIDTHCVAFDSRDFRLTLLPVLLSDDAARLRDDEQWGTDHVRQVRERLATYFPLSPDERAFVTGIREHGTIDGALLTSDAGLAMCIEQQPMLHWRILQCARIRKDHTAQEP